MIIKKDDVIEVKSFGNQNLLFEVRRVFDSGYKNYIGIEASRLSKGKRRVKGEWISWGRDRFLFIDRDTGKEIAYGQTKNLGRLR